MDVQTAFIHALPIRGKELMARRSTRSIKRVIDALSNAIPSARARLGLAKIDLALASLQVSALLAAIIALVFSLLLYRHQSDDYFLDAWTYFGSVRVAVPPLAILATSFVFAALTGRSVSDAPKEFLAWLRNVFFQSRQWLAGFVSIVLVGSVAVLHLITGDPPPSYERMVERLLTGDSDDLALFLDEIKTIRGRDARFADHLEAVTRVFVARHRWNYQASIPTTSLPRVLEGSLAARDDWAWSTHPLRQFAAAEAASMYAQALASSSNPNIRNGRRDEALRLYGQVATSLDPRATRLLQVSALNNIGNVHFYLGEWMDAVDSYLLALDSAQSVGAYGNLVAALLALRRVDEAFAHGERGKEWAIANGKVLSEPVEFANLTANVGFAQWLRDRTDEALSEFQMTYDLSPDANATQNLALALVLARRPELAVETARKLQEPIATASSLPDVLKKVGTSHCTYLVRGLSYGTRESVVSQEDSLVNLFAFVGEVHMESDIRKMTVADHHAVLARAFEHLKAIPSTCSTLALVPKIQQLMAGA
jgi:tetratricopeptide (TPR) repeat protein